MNFIIYSSNLILLVIFCSLQLIIQEQESLTKHNIPKDHPRAHSLKIRNTMIDSYDSGILSQYGLIAHGRGEAFDYILGETTNKISLKTIRVATALLLLSNSVISVNGNSAALCSKELVNLAKLTNSKIEINLFHKSSTRAKKISQLLKNHGAMDIYGINKKFLTQIPNLKSDRKFIDKRGIFSADVIFVPLEDGDRTEFLKKMNKTVITVDLNPLSRTSIMSDISIIDNIIRVIPEMVKQSENMSNLSLDDLQKIVNKFNNQKQLQLILRFMSKRLIDLST
ncbi:MAG: phosphopantothenate/pantothenate synthetase [Thaumarchaeota archaeon]|nr:phosphopantothenate/pantothenate synthetase [Nitrososphaerota archaeon]